MARWRRPGGAPQNQKNENMGICRSWPAAHTWPHPVRTGYPQAPTTPGDTTTLHKNVFTSQITPVANQLSACSVQSPISRQPATLPPLRVPLPPLGLARSPGARSAAAAAPTPNRQGPAPPSPFTPLPAAGFGIAAFKGCGRSGSQSFTSLSALLSGGKRPIARMPRLWSTQKCSASAGSTTIGVRYRKTTLAFEATCTMAGRGVQSAA